MSHRYVFAPLVLAVAMLHSQMSKSSDLNIQPETIEQPVRFASSAVTPRVYLIQNHQRKQFAEVLDDMHCKRYEVFIKQLGWDIPSENGREKDQFDIPQAIYMVYHDQKYGVCGGMRLLPTTSTYMLKDLFPYLVDHDQDKMPTSSKVWESTRFFFMKPKEAPDHSEFAQRGTLELLIALYEFGLSFKVERIVAVSIPHIENILKKIGWDYSRLAEPKLVDGKPVVVINLKISPDNFNIVRQKTGIKHSVSWMPLPFSIKNPEGFKEVYSSSPFIKSAL